MPKERTTLLETARITSVVISESAMSVTPKLCEYMTPRNVLLYTTKMSSPSTKATASARAMSVTLAASMFSKNFDLKMSLNVMMFPFFPTTTLLCHSGPDPPLLSFRA